MNRRQALLGAVVIGLLVGTAVALFPTAFVASHSGLLLALIGAVSLALYATLRRANLGHAAAFPLIFLATYAVVLGVGAVFNHPDSLSESTSTQTWLVVSLGAVAFAIGTTIPRMHRSTAPATPLWAARAQLIGHPRAILNAVTSVALFIAFFNLSTGHIAILSSAVTEARFAGDYGSFGRLWPLVFGVLQASFILRFLQRPLRSLPLTDWMFQLATVAVFLATASRSFLVLCLLAIAIDKIERVRPSLGTLAVLALVGALALGALGYVRGSSELGDVEVNASLEDRGLPPGIAGQTLGSMATGVRVLSQSLVRVPNDIAFQRGSFFLADGVNLFNAGTERSDRWVTAEVMDRNVETNGGMPPTLVGGLWIDFGWIGVAIGMSFLAWVTQKLYLRAKRLPTLARRSEYSFWCAYLLLSLYSYISLKPAVVAAVAVFEMVRVTERAAARTMDVHEMAGR